jgi:hypothetical protein
MIPASFKTFEDAEYSRSLTNADKPQDKRSNVVTSWMFNDVRIAS